MWKKIFVILLISMSSCSLCFASEERTYTITEQQRVTLLNTLSEVETVLQQQESLLNEQDEDLTILRGQLTELKTELSTVKIQLNDAKKEITIAENSLSAANKELQSARSSLISLEKKNDRQRTLWQIITGIAVAIAIGK